MKSVIILLLGILYSIPLIAGYTPATQWCYRCVSTQPGCGEEFNWLWHWSKACPEMGDKCVKIIERKGGETFITRDCLSVIRQGFRTDLPADPYEGCRKAIRDPHLANYVNNTIKELDIYRNHYDSIDFCFCFFQNRCNSAPVTALPPFLILIFSAYWLLQTYL